MVRLVNILKKQEKERIFFNEDKPALQEKPAVDSAALTSQDLYKELQNIMRQILLDISHAKPFGLEQVKQKINLLIDFVSRDDPAMLRLTETYDDSEDYLVVHGVNVCILSLEIARGGL